MLSDPIVHARWLNTLSYLENCGARLIAWSEHPTLVSREVLKHAAEEFRHAYYLKSLIHRVYPPGIAGYRPQSLLGGFAAYHYLQRLNVAISRWLQGRVETLREHAYLLVTYAIEQRAMQVYPAYEHFLRERKFAFSIRSIIREEEHHLAEIEEALASREGGVDLAHGVQALEEGLWRGLEKGLEWYSLFADEKHAVGRELFDEAIHA